MTQIIKDAGINWLQRLKRAWSQAITWVNSILTLIAMYVMSDPMVHAKFMPFIPVQYQAQAAIVLPLITFWIVQKAKEIDRKRTIAQTRLP